MGREMGIDLGTANVLIHLKGRGIILNEPSVVALDKRSHEIIAVGKEAYEMIGRTSDSIEIIRPLQGGVISDYDITEALLIILFKRIYRKRLFSKPNILISRPANISEIEQTALIEAIEKVGGGKIYMEVEAKVAGVGAGVDLTEPSGSMVIDIGGGTTDMAILSGGDIVESLSLKLAGDDFNQAIIQYFKDQHRILIGERSAEDIKIKLATAIPIDDEYVETAVLKGRDLVTGLPKSINVTSNHIYQALIPHLRTIARNAKQILEEAQPEVAADIIDKGILLTGGGSLIGSIDTYLTDYFHVSVIRADQPMNCVAIGTGIMLDLIQSGKLTKSNITWKFKVSKFLMRMKRRFFG